MKPEQVAVCTTTFYPRWEPGERSVESLLQLGDQAFAEHKVRGDLALQTTRAAMREGFQLAVVDGAEDSAFRDQLKKDGIPFMAETARGMSASRRQSFNAALDTPSVEALAWIEPEKTEMIEALQRCVTPVLHGGADMVIPARGKSGWSSLPAYQRESEQEGNRIWNEQLKVAGLRKRGDEEFDPYFGPRIYGVRAALRDRMIDILNRRYSFEKDPADPLHAAVNPGAYSEATFFPPIAAMHEGLRVQSIRTNFTYPEEQRVLEEHPAFVEGEKGYRAKRANQLTGILIESMHYLRLIGRSHEPTRLKRLP